MANMPRPASDRKSFNSAFKAPLEAPMKFSISSAKNLQDANTNIETTSEQGTMYQYRESKQNVFSQIDWVKDNRKRINQGIVDTYGADLRLRQRPQSAYSKPVAKKNSNVQKTNRTSRTSRYNNKLALSFTAHQSNEFSREFSIWFRAT